MSQAATPRDAGYSPRPDPNRPLTEQGLYNLLVYHYWDEYLPHTRKVVLPMERGLSYTLGHKQSCCRLDADGRVLNDRGRAPAIVHQYNKGAAGRALKHTRFFRRYLS